MNDAILTLLGAAGCFAFGWFCIFHPEVMWKLEHFLDVKDGEPSDFYLDKTRLLGTGMIVLGFFLAGMALFQFFC